MISLENLRKYGDPPYRVAVIHGGPGAPGTMAPVARELAGEAGVLEPLQTVPAIEGLIEELRTALEGQAESPVLLIGHSWGAWLSCLFASRHPALVRKLVLVGSGPFEERYALEVLETRLGRLTGDERDRLGAIMKVLHGPDTGKTTAAFSELGRLMEKVDNYRLLPGAGQEQPLAARPDQYLSVWAEANELRQTGELLRLSAGIRCPVVAIHGDYDPHPAAGVQEPLGRLLADFRLVLLERCGHEPWRERFARDRFYEILREELK